MQKVSVGDVMIQKKIDAWLSGPYDEATKQEIRRLAKEAPEELGDAFYQDLSFGTGGLRGLMGVGTNRMNLYTVRRTTQGLANVLKVQAAKGEIPSCAIGFDTRKHSKEFAQEAAKTLAANGIEVFLFDSFCPVPLVSFAVLYKKCSAGIMITASHNPPEYNGYKIYWEHGGQVLFPQDEQIQEAIEALNDLNEIKSTELSDPKIHVIGKEVHTAYIEALAPLQLTPDVNLSHGKELNIVYTPLHGAGIADVPDALASWGFRSVKIVEDQTSTDGSFPTVKTPNPEYPENLKRGIETLQQTKSDILIATDADTDRIGVVVMHQNKPVILSGNELAILALEHICRTHRQNKTLPPKPVVVKTIVTTELFKAIASSYSITSLDVLTGFKYIGEKIAAWHKEEQAPVASHHFLFGAEESYGYLIGTHVRDKDAVVMANLFAEIALNLKRSKKTLVDFLYEIYHKHGVWREKLVSFEFEGQAGHQKMKDLMHHLRTAPPHSISGIDVIEIEDYLNHKHSYIQTKRYEPIILPKSDVLRFWLTDRTKITIRPSGTEPKIKLYAEVMEKRFVDDAPSIEKIIKSCDHRLDHLLNNFKRTFLS